MNQLTLILVLITIMWYVIDNLKENIWGGLSYSRHITILAAAIVGFVLAFGYGLDLIYALEIVETATTIGQIVTALVMMGGSALVSEIVEMFRNKI